MLSRQESVESQNDPKARLDWETFSASQIILSRRKCPYTHCVLLFVAKSQTGAINVSFSSSSTASATCFHQVLPWKTPIAVWKYCILYQQSAINIASPTYNISFLKAAKCKGPLPFPPEYLFNITVRNICIVNYLFYFFMNKQTFEIRRVSLVRLFGDGLLSGFMKCLLSVRRGKTPHLTYSLQVCFEEIIPEFSAAIKSSRYRIAEFYSDGNLT